MQVETVCSGCRLTESETEFQLTDVGTTESVLVQLTDSGRALLSFI